MEKFSRYHTSYNISLRKINRMLTMMDKLDLTGSPEYCSLSQLSHKLYERFFQLNYIKRNMDAKNRVLKGAP